MIIVICNFDIIVEIICLVRRMTNEVMESDMNEVEDLLIEIFNIHS